MHIDDLPSRTEEERGALNDYAVIPASLLPTPILAERLEAWRHPERVMSCASDQRATVCDWDSGGPKTIKPLRCAPLLHDLRSPSQFTDKFIAFIDVLGFKQHVKAAEDGSGMSLPQLLELVRKLGAPEDRERFVKYGPTTCPHSTRVQRDLDFRVTQISDCAIVSAETSPAGLINLISHCWGAAIQLLYKGVLCRGFITRGSVYHTDNQVIGSGYQNAYENERAVSAFAIGPDDRGTPFVEVAPIVCEYVSTHGDSCVKEMFSRMVKTEGGVIALFPFQRISHGFIIGAKFDAQNEFAANQKVREGIMMLKERVVAMVDGNNQSAMKKVAHYLRALDSQLE